MKTFTYVSIFLAGMSLASAAAAPAPGPNVEGLVGRDDGKHKGTCNEGNQVCTYKVNGDSRKCNCGEGNGGKCTKTGNTCHFNANDNPNKCNCT